MKKFRDSIWVSVTRAGVIISLLSLLIGLCCSMFYLNGKRNVVAINSRVDCEFISIETFETYNNEKADDGKQWLKLHVKIINRNADVMIINADELFTFTDNNKKEISQSNDILGENALESAKVMKNGFLEGDVIFEVPDNKKTFTLYLHDATITYKETSLSGLVKSEENPDTCYKEVIINVGQQRAFGKNYADMKNALWPTILKICGVVTFVPLTGTIISWIRWRFKKSIILEVDHDKLDND